MKPTEYRSVVLQGEIYSKHSDQIPTMRQEASQVAQGTSSNVVTTQLLEAVLAGLRRL